MKNKYSAFGYAIWIGSIIMSMKDNLLSKWKRLIKQSNDCLFFCSFFAISYLLLTKCQATYLVKKYALFHWSQAYVLRNDCKWFIKSSLTRNSLSFDMSLEDRSLTCLLPGGGGGNKFHNTTLPKEILF